MADKYGNRTEYRQRGLLCRDADRGDQSLPRIKKEVTLVPEKFDKAAYDREYMKEHSVKKEVRFGKETDADLLAWIEKQPEGFSRYIRRLIREDMEKQ